MNWREKKNVWTNPKRKTTFTRIIFEGVGLDQEQFINRASLAFFWASYASL